MVSIWDHSGTGWGRFDVTLVSLGALGGRLGMTLGMNCGSFWDHFAHASHMQVRFQKHLFRFVFYDFNGSGVNSEPLWGHFEWLWVTLGSFLAYEAEFESL